MIPSKVTPVFATSGSGMRKHSVPHAQERELAVHRHYGQLRHVLAVRHDDAEPVEPAGYGEALRPGAGYQRMERSSMPPSRMAPERSVDQLVMTFPRYMLASVRLAVSNASIRPSW